MIRLKREYRPLLAVALLLAVAAVILGGIVSPLLRHYWDRQEQVTALQHQLEIYRRLAAQLPGQRDNLAQLQQQDPVAPLLFQESRPALAAASLQQLVGQLVSQAGGQLISTQILPRERSEGPLPEIGLRVQMRGDAQAAVSLLHGLAYSQPLLLTRNLSVTSNPRLRPLQRLTRDGGTGQAQLDIAFTVIGYTRSVPGEVTDE